MISKSNLSKNIASLGWAVFLSTFTLVLGGIPLLGLRRNAGRKWFWLGSLTVMLILAGFRLYPTLLVLSTIVILVGTYAEFEEAETPLFYGLGGAIVAALGFLGVTLAVTLKLTKLKLLPLAKQWVSTVVEQAEALQPNLQLQTESIYHQLPSVVIIAMVFTLVLSIIVDRYLRTEGNSEVNSGRKDLLLTKFYVPDAGVWLMCVALLASFSPNRSEPIEIVGVNLLNVLVVLYFLQGMSVMAKLFSVYKIGLGWRILWYFLLTFKLFLIVSAAGFIDYWLDFRRWLSKKMAEMN